MAEEETSAQPSGTVIRALTSTWTLNGRLLQPAMVIVAKPPTTKMAAVPQ
jgi:molecular chaperone GrpE (heat shock protein)